MFKIALVRELTKLHEEVLRLTLGEAIEKFNEDKPRGEYVIIVDGCSEEEIKPEEEWWSELSVNEHVESYINKGMSSKDAIKQTAVDRNVSKRDVYNEYHKS